MKKLLTTFLSLSASFSLFASPTPEDLAPERNRLVILADMGNEPDEEQQMVHMLVYANEFDIEGLIAVTGKYLRKGPRPDLFFKLIHGYAQVYENLQKHADDYPSPEHLQSVVAAGQYRYGIADTGTNKASPGSKLLERVLTKDDPRPVYIVVNAGSNTLAQAIIDLEKKLDKADFESVISKLRVFENGSQDNAGAWLCAKYPHIHWIRSNYQTYSYGGPSIDGGADNKGNQMELGPHTWDGYEYSNIGQHQWALKHIKGNHGPLAAMWPIRQFHRGGISFLEGGGTIPWLGLVNKGLYDIHHPHWGGWSGRYGREKEKNYWSKHSDIKVDEVKVAPFYVYGEPSDTWTNPEDGTMYEESLYAPIWRWRRGFFNDFVGRMDWCVRDFEEANHNPSAVIDGDDSNSIIIRKAKAGDILNFNASKSTDPDGDKLSYRWYTYPEAGTYGDKLPIEVSSKAKARFELPKNSSGSEIHLILEVQDNNEIISMFDYRRVVIVVE